MIDGLIKTPLYFVVTGSRSARRTICTPVRLRHRYTSYIKVFSEFIRVDPSAFYDAINLDGVVKSPIYFVVAGSRNARRTLCTPALT